MTHPKAFMLLLAFSFVFSFNVYGQNQNQEIKEIKVLKKYLVKHSSYQYYNQRIFFDPIEFEQCKVKYKFKTIESIGGGTSSSSTINSSPLESYARTRDLQPRKRDMVVGPDNTSVQTNIGRRNEITVRINEEERARQSRIVSFDLGKVEGDSINILNSLSGTFVSIKIAKSDGKKVDEVFPINKKNNAEKLKSAFQTAVQKCK